MSDPRRWDYSEALMWKELNSGQENLRSPAHVGDLAIVQQISAGDVSSWQSFLDTTRQAMSESAIAWCRRSAPFRSCRHCTGEGTSECTLFDQALRFMSDRFKSHDWRGFSGDVILLDYATALITSSWWQKDFESQANYASKSKHLIPPASADPHADLVFTWAILSDSRSAWDAFLESYNKDIERVANKWCHRVIPNRVCRFCRPPAGEGCDAFQNSYVYVLERLRRNALPAFRGRSPLSRFVAVCLHDYRWWKDFVEKETKKVKLPKALENAPTLVQKLYTRIAWGWDDQKIASHLNLSPEDIGVARLVLEERLRKAQLPLPLKYEFFSITGSDAEEGREHAIDPPAPTIDPDLRVEGVRFLESLPPQDRVIFKAHCEGYSAKDIAQAVDVSFDHIYKVIQQARRQLPAWFQDGAEKVAKKRPKVPSSKGVRGEKE